MRSSALLTALSLCLAFSGCENFFASTCTLMLERAVEVEVRDAETGAALAAGATGRIFSEQHEEALAPAGSVADTLISLGAYGPTGVYTVEVSHPGYEPWQREGVRVRAGECGIRTERLRAELQKLRPQR